MHDYLTPESDYQLGPGEHHVILSDLARALLSGVALRYGTVTATATSVVDRHWGPMMVDCDAFGAARVFVVLVGEAAAREAIEGARNVFDKGETK